MKYAELFKAAPAPLVESNAQKDSPEQILRDSGKKIKLITNTSFGKQIDFAKKYDDDDIKALLDGFTIKLKGKSVFIVD